jgi:hypothetical protein
MMGRAGQRREGHTPPFRHFLSLSASSTSCSCSPPIRPFCLPLLTWRSRSSLRSLLSFLLWKWVREGEGGGNAGGGGWIGVPFLWMEEAQGLPPSHFLPLLPISALPVIASLVRPGYFLGFYFWVDAIATASLFFEVPSVKNSILQVNSGSGNPELQAQGNFIVETGNLVFIFGKTARIAKVRGRARSRGGMWRAARYCGPLSQASAHSPAPIPHLPPADLPPAPSAPLIPDVQAVWSTAAAKEGAHRGWPRAARGDPHADRDGDGAGPGQQGREATGR